MNTLGAGGLGCRVGNIRASCGSWSPLRELHGAQEVTTLSQVELPPRLRGTTWSIVRRAAAPQYWHE
jgi:hypothetical protein